MQRASTKRNGWAHARLAVGLAPALAFAAPASADEPLFGYVNTTDLLPKGKWQLETWGALQRSQALGEYRALQGRTEVDYGLTSRVQLTAYLNYSDVDARIDAAAARALGLTPQGHVEESQFDGVTGEVIWRLASPYLDPAGFAVLLDGTTGRGQEVVGVKAIGQKNFRDDTVVLAANLRADFGLREPRATNASGLPSSRRVTTLEVSAGASYRFRPNWSAALEMRARQVRAGGESLSSAVFLGPTIHYGGERWFATLTALKRISASGAPDSALADSLVYARDRASWDGVRLRLGRTF
jgi:hypothetical protein